jgi:hypothetical protein
MLAAELATVSQQSLYTGPGAAPIRSCCVWPCNQVSGWVGKGVQRFEDMPNVPKPLRELLQQHLCLGTLQVAVEQVSTRQQRHLLDLPCAPCYMCANRISRVV